jgi:hypothetical protein
MPSCFSGGPVFCLAVCFGVVPFTCGGGGEDVTADVRCFLMRGGGEVVVVEVVLDVEVIGVATPVVFDALLPLFFSGCEPCGDEGDGSGEGEAG